jgi:hypothetical protein
VTEYASGRLLFAVRREIVRQAGGPAPSRPFALVTGLIRQRLTHGLLCRFALHTNQRGRLVSRLLWAITDQQRPSGSMHNTSGRCE